MELTERIESINRQLENLFGIDTVTGKSMWRVVWSGDQFEKRLTNYSREGLQLITPQVIEAPKYPYIKERYVLERLVVVPEVNKDDLPTSRLSYEPIWVFQTAEGNYLPPTVPACKFVVDTVYASQGKRSLAKYVEDEKFTTEEGRQQIVSELQEELFGNETEVTDALRYREGVVVPSNYHTTKES